MDKAGSVIIDEFKYLSIGIDTARLLFQIIVGGYETKSIIFASNLEFSN
ncbi:ATP-binding protein [Bifidobacterium adolescentis]